jgi:ribosome maturation factor RimP
MGGVRHELLLGELRRIASQVAEEAGVELVDLELRGSSNRRRLRVDIDKSGPRGVDLDDCQKVSKALGLALDEADPIGGSYVLEVSSPGADRPISSADDIRRNTGRRIVVTTEDSEEGMRSVRGLLLGETNGCLKLAEEGNGEVEIPLGKVRIARQDIGI